MRIILLIFSFIFLLGCTKDVPEKSPGDSRRQLLFQKGKEQIFKSEIKAEVLEKFISEEKNHIIKIRVFDSQSVDDAHDLVKVDGVYLIMPEHLSSLKSKTNNKPLKNKMANIHPQDTIHCEILYQDFEGWIITRVYNE